MSVDIGTKYGILFEINEDNMIHIVGSNHVINSEILTDFKPTKDELKKFKVILQNITYNNNNDVILTIVVLYGDNGQQIDTFNHTLTKAEYDDIKNKPLVKKPSFDNSPMPSVIAKKLFTFEKTNMTLTVLADASENFTTLESYSDLKFVRTTTTNLKTLFTIDKAIIASHDNGEYSVIVADVSNIPHKFRNEFTQIETGLISSGWRKRHDSKGGKLIYRLEDLRKVHLVQMFKKYHIVSNKSNATKVEMIKQLRDWRAKSGKSLKLNIK